MMTTYHIMKDCINVLMHAMPEDFDYDEIVNDLQSIEGVVKVHDLHIWELSMSKPILTVHLISDEPQKVLYYATKLLRQKHEIGCTTIQVESTVSN